MENVKRNVDTTKNLTPFTTEYQPSPEAKKKGWERRRMAQEMMDLYDKYMHMNYDEFLRIKEDVRKNPNNYTVLEVDMFKYAKNPKFIVDRIDRHISKAPQQVDVTTGDKPLSNIKFVFTEEDGDQENKDIPQTETGSPDSK